MQPYQSEFIAFCLECGVLKFGEFTLKSGRVSPYFFNAGLFKTGRAFLRLGEFYAAAIQAHFPPSDYDLLFGPAYKGIPLATAASIGLAKQGLDVPVCFNRKEVKDHGEGGVMIGASLKHQRALLIDDVITAGTTVRESLDLMAQESGTLVGIMIALNRQEVGLSAQISAVQEVQSRFGLKVASLISRDDLIQFLEKEPSLMQYIPAMVAYKKVYGV